MFIRGPFLSGFTEKLYWFSFLHQYRTSNHRGICFNFKQFLKIGKGQNWCCSELCLKNVKTFLLSFFPIKFSLLQTICDRGYNSIEISNKPSIKGFHVKTPNLSYWCWWWPISYRFDLFSSALIPSSPITNPKNNKWGVMNSHFLILRNNWLSCTI